MNEATDAVLDTRGLHCPEPVMLLHNRIRDMRGGETVLVLATDPSTRRDIPKFCQFLGHDLLSQQESGEEFHYRVRKKA